jgi:hypothetical protein
MGTRSENGRIGTELCLALERLCDGRPSAVRVACIPNGLEHRFFVRVEAPWRAEVYAFLAGRTRVRIPPDGGPLNLSLEEAQRVGQLVTECCRVEQSDTAQVSRRSQRQPPRMAGDRERAALRDTFQP